MTGHGSYRLWAAGCRCAICRAAEKASNLRGSVRTGLPAAEALKYAMDIIAESKSEEDNPFVMGVLARVEDEIERALVDIDLTNIEIDRETK